MLPLALIASTDIPGGAGTLRLMRRGDEFSIMQGATELMNSRRSGSEAALAELTCERLVGRPPPRLLIGGLGMGFTLRAALARLDAEARVDVAELVPAVLDWARGPLAGLFGNSLADPRVTVHEADVGDLIRTAHAGSYDAILLDVDNGPAALSRPANDRLYGPTGLAAAGAALRPGGVLAIWSAAPDQRFTQRLRSSGFDVEERRVRANGAKGGSRQIIWLATRGPQP